MSRTFLGLKLKKLRTSEGFLQFLCKKTCIQTCIPVYSKITLLRWISTCPFGDKTGTGMGHTGNGT